ncbi:nuclease-related domain-containing protein [Streptomyces sp. NPDC059070]|uniref:nuclease-related domain-containing protein n=1 Tax=unclassified Streptomyces TaxID=2593676 RepID=UPI0034E21DE3
MSGLRVTPVHRHGRARLYVSLADGTNAAWYDRESGRVSLLIEERREEVLAALAPFVTGDVSVGPPPVPTAADLARLSLHPDDDLAPNRPGEALLAALERHGEQRRFRQDPRRAELAAHERVGAQLDALEGAGWRVLHSVPLPGEARLDHLLIGPAGVLTVRTVAAARHRVRLADPLVTVGRAAPQPLLRRARHDAERASLALTAGVRPLVVLAGADRVDGAGPHDVRVVRDTGLAELGRLGGVLKPGDIEGLYWTARDRRTWLKA